jgi:ribosomal protein S18 acetylase RimI-like enzyme
MKVKIKPLRIADYDDIVSVWERGGMKYDPDGRDSRKAIVRQMEMNPGLYLGAFDGKKLVGVMLVSSDGRRGWLNRTCIDPDYRRKGIAKMLIIEAERRLRKRGIKLFAAHVEEDNTASLALCESMGYIPRRDIVYMRKKED